MALDVFLNGIACDPEGTIFPEQLVYADSDTDCVKSLKMFVRYGVGETPTPQFFVSCLQKFASAAVNKHEAFEELLKNIAVSEQNGFSTTHIKQAMMFEITDPGASCVFQPPQFVEARMAEQFYLPPTNTDEQSKKEKKIAKENIVTGRLAVFKAAADIIVAKKGKKLGIEDTLQRTTEFFQKNLFQDASKKAQPLLAIRGQGNIFVVGDGRSSSNIGRCPFSAPLRKPASLINLAILHMGQQFGGLDKAGITPELMQPVADFLNAHPNLKKMRL